MSQWAGGVLTAAGRALQAKVEAGTTALVLTKIKLGDGTESMDAVDNLTNLVGPKAVLGISSALADGDHATITGVVLSSQLQAGFWCREWGLFATDPDAGEILYMITIDNQPEWIPASTAAAQVSATYAMNVAVANATNITVAIDPAGLVDVEMLENFVGVPGRSKAIALGTTGMLENLPAGWFLECTTAGTTGATTPVITNPTVGGTVTDGTVVWTIRKSASTQDLTKYLSLSGGNMTGSIGRTGNTGILSIKAHDHNGTTGDGYGAAIDLYGSEVYTGVNDYANGRYTIISSGKDADDPTKIRYTVLEGRRSGALVLQHFFNRELQYTHDIAGSAIVAKSIGPYSGYVKNASGLIMQYATISLSSYPSGSTINYNVSFQGNYPAVFYSFVSDSNEYHNKTITTATESNTGFTIYYDFTSNKSITFFAVGY